MMERGPLEFLDRIERRHRRMTLLKEMGAYALASLASINFVADMSAVHTRHEIHDIVPDDRT